MQKILDNRPPTNRNICGSWGKPEKVTAFVLALYGDALDILHEISLSEQQSYSTLNERLEMCYDHQHLPWRISNNYYRKHCNSTKQLLNISLTIAWYKYWLIDWNPWHWNATGFETRKSKEVRRNPSKYSRFCSCQTGIMKPPASMQNSSISQRKK